MKERKDIFVRFVTLTLGLFLMAAGIVLCIRAGLGITPISCPPYVLSLALPFTIGQFTILMHLLLILGQWILLRRGFRGVQLLQIIPALIVGLFIDCCMWLTDSLVSDSYLTDILVLLAGNALMALGMYFEIKSRLILVPTDGFVQALSRCSGSPFPKMKIAFDVSLLLVSVVCSQLLLGRIEGIREGTLVSAFGVGYLLGIVRRILD